ncbi:SDR family NAD(P)-dependent oxidoreductase [Exiguobacterium aestuarii]|uniref:SDR family NAD(P)-dependent oxidoreductase n=1 Tax=Exiguobacterium aestuarii TaxID=273527 RepID=A0ABW2PJP0_9BACL|nr:MULTISPECIES: SDR family oxidoreductase [Exiguobacterium]MCT4787089.1 SDR family oxidoreductase [Exiguobacterium aestuarii]
MKDVMIITGVTHGIGYALANAFVDQYEVIGLDIEDDPHIKGMLFYQVDLGNTEELQRVFEDIKTRVGRAHVLINNGGIASLVKPIDELNVDTFKRVIDVNLVGTFTCAKYFLELNHDESYGRIVNMASTRASQNEPHWDAYGASKGGIVGLTHSLAISLSERPVTVNAISPGWIHTSEDSLREVDHRQHPSGRVGEPDDIVRAVSYLIDRNNDFVNGHNLVVDGGMTKKMIYEE